MNATKIQQNCRRAGWPNQQRTVANPKPKSNAISGLMQNQMQEKNGNKSSVCASYRRRCRFSKVQTAEIHVGAAEGSHETYNFHPVTRQRDIICQILKFLFADCDVCQIIQPPVSVYYLLTSAMTVWRIKTQALNRPNLPKGILHPIGEQIVSVSPPRATAGTLGFSIWKKKRD